MKLLKLFLVLPLLFILGCGGSGDSSTTSGSSGSSSDTSTVLQEFTIDLDGVDNIIVNDVVVPNNSSLSINRSVFSFNDDGNIFTNDEGQIFTITLPSGHLVKKPHKVYGSSNKIALTLYIDATGDVLTTTCMISLDDGICDPEEYEPRKMSNLGNSPTYQKNGNIIRYLSGNNLIEYDEVSDEKMVIPFASNGQLSINNNGHMMMFDGAKTKIKASFDLDLPDVPTSARSGLPAELFPNTKKFFIPHKTGFLVQGGTRGDFYRVSDSSGDLDVKFAQYNAYDTYINVGGGFNRITSNAGLSNCTSHIVGDDDIMICGSKVYLLGDQNNDMIQKDFIYAGHTIYDLTIKAGNAIYFYSKSEINNWYKLTKEDLVNEISTTITEDYKIIPDCFDVNKGVTDTLDIGAHRAIDDVQVILKITDANTSPVITETIGECDQIVSF